MEIKTPLLSLMIVLSSTLTSQTIFEQYKADKAAGRETSIPDFSYAGYECGEKAIPNVKSKVFDITKFGAVPNDDKSDKEAIQLAIKAAEANGSGIVYFPKGVYNINEMENKNELITISGSNIILRGEDGAVLFMKQHNDPKDPDKLWTTPYLIQYRTKSRTSGAKRSITSDCDVHQFSFTLDNTNGLNVGDWIEIEMKNNDVNKVANELAPYKTVDYWRDMNVTGVTVRVYHQIAKIEGNKITLRQPIAYPILASEKWIVQKWNPMLNNGIENITFRGNYHDKFRHHGSAVDDSGYSFISMKDNANGWITNCIFEDVSSAARLIQCANMSVMECLIRGNMGHLSIATEGSTNCLIGKCIDTAGQWHAFGTAKPSMNTVIWRCEYPASTCFESHASQPRNTLFDCVKGGLQYNREGGAEHLLPSHLGGLVLWNYERTNEKIWRNHGEDNKLFVFWDDTQKWWKFLPPVIAGFYGVPTDFDLTQLKQYEALGSKTQPESLYEAQFELRTKKKVKL